MIPSAGQDEVVAIKRFAERFSLCQAIVFGALFDRGLISKDADEAWELTEDGAERGGEYGMDRMTGRFIAFPFSVLQDAIPFRASGGQPAEAPSNAPSLAARFRPAGTPVSDEEESSVAPLSTADLARRFGVETTQINRVLSELGWIQRAEGGGWTIAPIGHHHGAVAAVAEDGTPEVRWTSTAGDDPLLDGAVSESKSDLAATVNGPRGGLSHGRQEATVETYWCQDGHTVASSAEAIIDNWLYQHEVPHACGREVPVEEPLVAGFYLPGPTVYIEYWDLGEGGRGAERMLQKRQVYRKYRCRLIEITPADLADLDRVMTSKLSVYGVKVARFD